MHVRLAWSTGPTPEQETHFPSKEIYEFESGHSQDLEVVLKTKVGKHWQAGESDVKLTNASVLQKRWSMETAFFKPYTTSATVQTD